MRLSTTGRALAGFQGLAAAGILAWWVYWFASGSQTHGERCALAYENSFPLADLVLAGALALTARALLAGRTAAGIGALAGGMAFSLATLDTAHNLLTGGFAGPLETTLRKALFAVVNGGVGAWTLVWIRRQGGVPGPLAARPLQLGAGGLLLASLGWTALGDGCAGALALSGVGVGGLATGLALGARGPIGAHVLAGVLVHAWSVAASHGVLELSGGGAP